MSETGSTNAGEPLVNFTSQSLASLVLKWADLAFRCIECEFPNKIAHVLLDYSDAKPPRQLTPIFYGCFDWHSAVHGHWTLLRALRLNHQQPESDSTYQAFTDLLDRQFTSESVAGEINYLSQPMRKSFEFPYGQAWLLLLLAELSDHPHANAPRWKNTLAPLGDLVSQNFLALMEKLPAPNRSGEHPQSAFALGLACQWAQTQAKTDQIMPRLESKIRAFYHHSTRLPWSLEPAGYDFLSPTLASADVLARVLSREEFLDWLSHALPDLPTHSTDGWLTPETVKDPADGKLVHLAGLNWSRAWMMHRIAHHLPTDDGRRELLFQSSQAHARAAFGETNPDHYAGSHWLGTFAVYWASVVNDATF